MIKVLENGTMPVPRCDSCGLWRENPTHLGWGACLQLTIPDIGLRPLEDARMALDNPRHLAVRADFGCVQWERKAE